MNFSFHNILTEAALTHRYDRVFSSTSIMLQILGSFKKAFIRTKRSEQAKRAHSVLREVEKMGYKKIFTRTHIG